MFVHIYIVFACFHLETWPPGSFCIWEHILRCPPYIMSYTMLPYNSVWKSRKSYISWYTQYISRYTIIRVTQYMSVYLSMKFSDKVYTCMYWVHACIYFYSWFFVLNERAPTCTYSYVWAHTMCNCFVPACARPARLHPAGPPAPCGHAAHSKAAHPLQQQDTLGQEQTSLFLCRQLLGSPKAASSSAVAETLAALAAPASGSELDRY